MNQITLLIKPAGASCNMACQYCYYQDVAKYQTMKKKSMDRAVMLAIIKQAFTAVDETGKIQFAFQGGEPTCAGLAFFEAFIAAVQQLQTRQSIGYSLQTNGLFIDDAWIAFLKRHDVLTGISLDGYAKLHDEMRVDKQGKGTYWQVVRAYEKLRKAGVRVNVLCVMHANSVAHMKGLYQFFVQQHVEYVQFIPCLEELKGGPAYLQAQQFAQGYITLFELWWKDHERGGKMHVGLFDDLLLMCMDQLPLTCGRLGLCAFQNVIEADGTIYPCDFYAEQTYACGNITTTSLGEARLHKAAEQCLKKERPTMCQTCEFLKFCHGDCKRKRRVFLEEEKGYCGYRLFLEHSLPRIIHYAQYLKYRQGA